MPKVFIFNCSTFDGTIKTKESIKESPIEELGNAASKFVDNTAKTLQGKPIDTSPNPKSLPGT